MGIRVYDWGRQSETLSQKEKVGQTEPKNLPVDHVEPLKDREQENGSKEAEEAQNWGKMGD